MNLYAYVGNDPVNAVDPNGRKIELIFENAATHLDAVSTAFYLAKSPAAVREIMQIGESDRTYTITFDRAAPRQEYAYRTRNITINPTLALTVKSSGKVQTPALSTGHEITHAAEHDRKMDELGDIGGTEAFRDALGIPTTYEFGPEMGKIMLGISQEEARATNMETLMADQLGEAIRKNYHDTGPNVVTCGPAMTEPCK